MADYIERERLKEAFNADLQTLQSLDEHTMNLILMDIDEAPDADVAPVVHGTPVLRYRPERYERYDDYGLNENGEMLYLKRVLVDEKSYAMYCPACGKRLCSRFRSFCPNCGAKMDGAN